MLSDCIAVLDNLEFHPQPKIHIPLSCQRTCGNAEGIRFLRRIHSSHHHAWKLPRRHPDVERVPCDRHQHGPQLHHRVHLPETRCIQEVT